MPYADALAYSRNFVTAAVASVLPRKSTDNVKLHVSNHLLVVRAVRACPSRTGVMPKG
jgi:hypothetical protein